jgi:RecB family exonuclease
MHGRTLIVVRDRAHAREHSQSGHPETEIWTVAEFFTRLHMAAFVRDPQLTFNAELGTWAAAQACLDSRGLPPSLAPNHLSLLHALWHGRSSAKEVAGLFDPGAQGREGELATLFERLLRIERNLEKSRQLDGVAILARAVGALESGAALPPAVARFSKIVVEGLSDLTDLEVDAFVATARLGTPVTWVLPGDREGRGIRNGVIPIEERIYQAHDVSGLDLEWFELSDHPTLGPFLSRLFHDSAAHPADPMPEAVGAQVLSNPDAEASFVASTILGSEALLADPDATVAVALRTLDEHADRITDALDEAGIDWHRRTGPTLLAAPVGALVHHLLCSRRDGHPRSRLLTLIAHPALKSGLADVIDVGRLRRVMRLAVARSDVEDVTQPRGGYRHRLMRFHEANPKSQVGQDAAWAVEILETVMAHLDAVPEEAPLARFVNAVRTLMDTAVTDGGDFALERSRILEALSGWALALESRALQSSKARKSIRLSHFIRLFERLLSEIRMPAKKHAHRPRVEVLSTPELMGRKFDLVILPDLAHGRTPRPVAPDPLLQDADRAQVNQRLGRPVLRLYDDDPLEPGPLPPRQALEPLIFTEACRSAQAQLVLCMSGRDAEGREQAPGEFFEEALLALGQGAEATRAGTLPPTPRGPRRRRFDQARVHAGDDEAIAPGPNREKLDLLLQMQRDRDAFFRAASLDDEERPTTPFAFALEPAQFVARFADKLGLKASRALTPSRLEPLARCHFAGFVEKLLEIDTELEGGHDADARALGHLAHEVLETFYQERRDQKIPAERMTPTDRRRVRSLVRELARPILAGATPGHLPALRADVLWLETALVRMASMLARDAPVEGVKPAHFELNVGARSRGGASSGEPLALDVAGRVVFFGGIIDRVDEGEGQRVVVDYKLSRKSTVEAKVKEEKLLKTEFQLPLYLRLLEHRQPSPDSTELFAYLVAIRDGAHSPVLGLKRLSDLRRRIMDDDAPDGLRAGIEAALAPLFAGKIVPDENERCATCRLARVCRLPKNRSDAEDGGGVADHG